MNGTASDQALIAIISASDPNSLDDVVNIMEAIDALLPGSDGLKWFNWLYLTVTREVQNAAPAGGFNNPQWITKLDIVFANFYFAALNGFIRGSSPTPSSWQALFESRHQVGIERIQFAVAGINAHINRDLSLALLRTNAELNLNPTVNSPEHEDYEHINNILEAVLPQVLLVMAEGGVIGEIAQDTGKVGRLLAIWNARQARDLAWAFTDHLEGLKGIRRHVALLAQDKLTGVIGRSLLH